MSSSFRVMQKNADQVVRFYKRRCWWVSAEDLRQEALMAQLDAERRFDVSKVNEGYGDHKALERYLYFVATYAVRRQVLKSSSPVSASHRLDVLVGLYRAPVREDNAGIADNAEHAYYARQVIDRVVRLLGEDGAKFAFAMIIDGWDAQDVAEVNNVPRQEVLQEVSYIRGALMADATLHALWREGT